MRVPLCHMHVLLNRSSTTKVFRRSSCHCSAAMTTNFSKESARTLLLERYGHKNFRKGQWEPIKALLEGRDALVVMPTGSGKSIIYQLPAVMLPGLTVVVSPLIALMKDQKDKL